MEKMRFFLEFICERTSRTCSYMYKVVLDIRLVMHEKSLIAKACSVLLWPGLYKAVMLLLRLLCGALVSTFVWFRSLFVAHSLCFKAWLDRGNVLVFSFEDVGQE